MWEVEGKEAPGGVTSMRKYHRGITHDWHTGKPPFKETRA